MSSRTASGCLFEIVETLVLTILIVLGIQTFVAQPYRVQQMSMEHTLEPGQYVLVDKLTPRFAQYRRGDIVIFAPPASFRTDGDTPLIKRIIGVGGDSVEIRGDGFVYVNGTKLMEPYLYERQPTVASGGRTSWTIAPGEFFVMGDHRADSTDSRIFGPIAATSIVGRAWLRYWPLDGFGVLATPTYAGLTTAAFPTPARAPDERQSGASGATS